MTKPGGTDVSSNQCSEVCCEPGRHKDSLLVAPRTFQLQTAHTPFTRRRMRSELQALIKMVSRKSASKMSAQTWVVLSLLVFSQLSLLAAAQEEGGAGMQGSNGDDTVNIDIVHTDDTLSDVVTTTTAAATTAAATTPVENLNTTTLNTTSVESSSPKGNTGAIVGAAVIAVTACFVVVLGVFLFKRRRQFRMQDKEKKMQIQMSSARNAGVYHDLTVSVPADDKPSASPEHEHLKATEDA